MITSFNSIGLEKTESRKILQKFLDANADILIGVDDPEVNELINILIDGFVEVIDRNNDEIKSYVDNKISALEEGLSGLESKLGHRRGLL